MEPQHITLRSKRLWVRFEKSLDRFSQTLGIDEGDGMLVCLEPATIDPNSVWPDDAPFQQIVLEPVGRHNTCAALGVGLCGHGHWSMAAEPTDGDGSRLRFDVACKATKMPERLSSGYRVSGNCLVSVVAQEPQRLVLRLFDVSDTFATQFTGDHWVDIIASQGHEITFESTIGVIVWEPHTRGIRIEPTGPFDRVGTYRWCYTIAVSAT